MLKIYVLINFGLINHMLKTNVQQNKNCRSRGAPETGYYALWNSEHSKKTVALHRTQAYHDLGA